MKPKYTKPQILFEDFSLAESIAASCAWIGSTAASARSTEVCAVVDPELGHTVFSNYLTCEYIPQNGEYGNLCYHVPVEDMNVFTS